MLSYDYGMNPLHTLLNYPGYTEGWATYVEMLSYHYLGLDEKMANLLQHNQSVILSLYATSDIGIHYLGWKTEEMEAFWKNYGITDSNTTINAPRSSIPFIANWPKDGKSILSIL